MSHIPYKRSRQNQYIHAILKGAHTDAPLAHAQHKREHSITHREWLEYSSPNILKVQKETNEKTKIDKYAQVCAKLTALSRTSSE